MKPEELMLLIGKLDCREDDAPQLARLSSDVGKGPSVNNL